MWKSLAVAACAIVVPGVASAEGITYDCDTAPGHYSVLDLPAPAEVFTVSGKVKVNAIAKDKKWAPLVRVRIGSAPLSSGSAPADYAGFTLVTLAGKDVGIAAETVQAVSFDRSVKVTNIIPSSVAPTGAVLPFRLTFDGRNIVVEVAGQSRSFVPAVKPNVVQVVCSTGEFLFTDLKLEHKE